MSGTGPADDQPADDQPAVEARPAPLTRRWRLALLAAAAGGIVAVAVMPFVHTGGRVGPARMDVVVRPALGGDTVIGVPPFGRVIVDSHRVPLELRGTIAELDVPALQRLAQQDDIEGHLRSTAEHDVGALLRRAVLRLLLVSLAAGAVAGLMVGRAARRVVATPRGRARAGHSWWRSRSWRGRLERSS